MTQYVDPHRPDITFEVGDFAYLKLRPYHQQTVARRTNMKLNPCFCGPFKVLERLGQVACRLELPASASIHPVFHVSQLCKVVGTTPVSCNLPLFSSDSLSTSVEPEAVLAYRSLSAGPEVLIKWVALPVTDAFCELVKHMKKQFPTFHLEDKVAAVQGGSIDRQKGPTNDPSSVC
ncbi:hypothetical protein Sjap_010655 [Stephania japonica]|uniref:Tf2-1-like SH3-like domain-containing protein n=1 Tax=Stephania japonica TaxID=461633 RepID=A0AAP0JA05_9MAGN